MSHVLAMFQDMAKIVELRSVAVHALHDQLLENDARLLLLHLEVQVVSHPEDIVLVLQLPNAERHHHSEEDAEVPRVFPHDAESVEAVLHELVVERGTDAVEDLGKLLGEDEGGRLSLESEFRLCTYECGPTNGRRRRGVKKEGE